MLFMFEIEGCLSIVAVGVLQDENGLGFRCWCAAG